MMMLPGLHRLRLGLGTDSAAPTAGTSYEYDDDGWMIGWESDDGDGDRGADSPPSKRKNTRRIPKRERMVSETSPEGHWLIYEGKAGEEHLVKYVSARGVKTYYKGKAGEEQKYLTVTPKGSEYRFEGPRNEEHMVSEYHKGRTFYYRGPKGQEYKWRMVEGIPPSVGIITYYKGPRGQERIVRRTLEGHEDRCYTGPKGFEKPIECDDPKYLND